MRLATWNVNSLRSRIDRVEAFLQRHDVDVLALQETKAREDQLPLMGLQALGYDVAVAGTNQWNGVALVSRVGLEDVQVGFEGMPGWGDPEAAESRALGATCGGVRVWSLYVPNGRKPDDPHYVYKLDWMARLREAAAPWRDRDHGPGRRLERLPDRRGRLRPGTVREVHARDARRAGRLPGVPRRRLRRRRTTPHPRAGRLHLLGLLPAALRAQPRAADRLRARPPPRWPDASPAPSSTATSGPAPAPPTTPRWWSTSWTHDPVRRGGRRQPYADPRA